MHVLLFAKDLAFLSRLIVNFLFLYFIACNIAKYMSKLIRELSCKGRKVQGCPPAKVNHRWWIQGESLTTWMNGHQRRQCDEIRQVPLKGKGRRVITNQPSVSSGEATFTSQYRMKYYLIRQFGLEIWMHLPKKLPNQLEQASLKLLQSIAYGSLTPTLILVTTSTVISCGNVYCRSWQKNWDKYQR